MRKLLILLSLFFVQYSISGDRKEIFHGVDVPVDIQTILKHSYESYVTNPSGGAETNVWNLIDSENKRFVDGIYVYKGRGPHFPRQIFIYNDGKIYIFHANGFCNPKGIIQEYSLCLDSLLLTNRQTIDYLNAITRFLDEENERTYGREFIYINDINYKDR